MEDIKRKPRGLYDKDKYCKDRLQEFIEGRRKRLKLSQRSMGAILGMTQQAFSMRVSNSQFNYLQLVKMFEELEATDEEILALMRREK